MITLGGGHREALEALRDRTRGLESDPLLGAGLVADFPFIAMQVRTESREVVAASRAAAAAGAAPGTPCHRSLWGLAAPCTWCEAKRAWTEGKPAQAEFERFGRLWQGHWLPLDAKSFLHVVFDVTDVKPAEMARPLQAASAVDRSTMDELGRKLGNREEALVEAARIAALGHYEIDVATGRASWSDEVFRIFGMNPEDGEPSVATYARHLHPDDVERLYGHFSASTEKGVPFDLEYRIVRPTGEVRRVHSVGHVRAGRGGARSFFGVLQDVTDRARMVEDLRDSEARFRALAEQSPSGVLIIQRDLLRYANPAAADILGVSAARKSPVSIADVIGLFDPEDRVTVQREYEQKLGGVKQSSHYRARIRRGGTTRHLVIHSATIAYEGAPAVIANLLDVTEARLAEIALERQQTMATLGLLTASVAHDIAGPTQTILSNSELLDEAWAEAASLLGRSGDEAENTRLRGSLQLYLSRIRGAALRIDQIARGLKDFYARRDFVTTPVAVNEVVAAALAAADSFLPAATQRLRVELADGLPPVIADPEKLEQVLINVLQNACQALNSPRDAVSVSTSARAEPAGIEIRVADEGVGIAPEDLQRMGEPFYTTRSERGGTGLGLTVSRLVVDRLGGTLTIESERGAGTVVRIFLPQAPAVDQT